MGISVGVYKPVESGCKLNRGRRIAPDAQFLKWASESELDDSVICPYPLHSPIAPVLAAEEEGITISEKEIVSGFKTISNSYDVVIVEGAGGLLSPLWSDKTSADLATKLNIPIMIVAPNRLGVVNQVRLTLEVLRARKLDVLCVVLNDVVKLSSGRDKSIKTNEGLLRRYIDVELCSLPHKRSLTGLKPSNAIPAEWRALADLGRNLNPEKLAKAIMS